MAYYSQRRKAEVYFSSHRDSFVHGANEWKTWLTTSFGQLHLVKLILSNGRQIYSTFSLKPALPSGISKRRLRPEQYLEIDPKFAKSLHIQEGEVVVVECVKDVIVARKITVALENSNDHEVMILNQEKMAHDILDQIRIVSSDYPFSIWINNQPILLKLVNSEPNSKWVLIAQDTYVEFQPPSSSGANSTLSTPTSSSLMSPLRAHSSGSTSSEVNDYFSQAHHNMPQRQMSGVHTKQPSYSSNLGHRSSFSDPVIDHPVFCSTNTGSNMADTESVASSQNESYGIVSNIPQLMQGMLGTFGNLFRQNLPPQLTKDDRKKSLSSDKPHFAPNVSPSKTYHHGMTSHHSRQQSWSFSQREEAERQHLPLYVSTPEFDAPFRVQVPPASGETFSWSTSQCFDVFVHPLSLPDLYHSFVMSKTTQKEISFLVQLCVDCCIVANNGKSEGGKANGKNAAATAYEKQESQVPEKSDESERDVMGVMSGIWKGFTGKTQAANGNLRPQPHTPTSQCRIAVARLIFATHVQFGRKLQSRSSLEEASSRQNSFSSIDDSFSPKHQVIPPNSIAVIPGHVMMSSVLQRQLGLKINSLVRLLHVKEPWRILSSFYKVSIGLSPITNNTGIKEKQLRLAFRQWVKACQSNPFGCVFSNNMVVPLSPQRSQTPSTETLYCHSDDLVLCRVLLHTELSTRDGGRQRERSSPDPPLRFIQLSMNDIEPKDRKIVPVNITIHEGGGDEDTLPSLKELGPVDLGITTNQLGAMDRYVRDGMDYISMALSRRISQTMLICSSGGGASGCGKTSLAKLLCQEASQHPLYAHPVLTKCTLLRGRNVESLKKKLKEVKEEAILHQPVVVVLDDLDELAEQVSDIQKDASGEGMSNTRTAQVVLDFLTELHEQQSAVVVIATAGSRATVHPLLLQSRGKHVFDKIIEITPPTLNERQDIVKAIIHSRVNSSIKDSELRSVVLRTEGYQAGDLVSLVNRAISLAEQQRIRNKAGPTKSSPRHLDFFKSTKKDSVATIVNTTRMDTANVTITAASLHDALEGFVPTSLRSLVLHKGDGVDFSNVGGLATAKIILRETLQWPSKYPKLFGQCPIKQHAGVLLYGAPGTGKTLLAGAVAKEFGLNFVSINGPELLNKYIGASEQAVRDLFGRAQSARPCILFFDEFDSLAPPRGHDRTGVTDRVVNQLLTQLDGVELLEGVYVLAATSRPDLIDPALLRPGRIDKTLFCDLPSQEEREEILNALGRSLPLAVGVSLQTVAAQTEHFTGADLKALLYNAQLLAANQALQTSQNRSSSLTGDAEKTFSEESEDDSGYGKRNSIASSISSSSNSEKTHAVSQQTNSHSKRDHSRTRPDQLLEERMWEFHMSGEHLKQEMIKKVPKEVERLLKPATGDHQEEQPVLKCEITMDQMQTALSTTKPSLSQSERERYRKIFNKFVGNTPVNMADYSEQRVTHA